jgi:predicted nucleic acid-binding protein
VTGEPVIVDSSSLLNFVLTGSLDLLLGLSGYSFRIPPRVYVEMEPGRGREAVLKALEAGALAVESLTNDEMAKSEALQEARAGGSLDAGESQVVAVAICRGWRALVDDRAAQRVLKSQRGEGGWLTTPEIIVEAIGQGRLNVDQADALREAMDGQAHFRMKGFGSFRELLGK